MVKPDTDAKPQYDCAATGQLNYRTFDGKVMEFSGKQCRYLMMSDCLQGGDSTKCEPEDPNTNINVYVKNERCKHSFEAYMCKKVFINLKVEDGRKVDVELLQHVVDIKEKGKTIKTFVKGNYSQPKVAVLDGLEVFKVRYFISNNTIILQHDVNYC